MSTKDSPASRRAMAESARDVADAFDPNVLRRLA